MSKQRGGEGESFVVPASGGDVLKNIESIATEFERFFDFLKTNVRRSEEGEVLINAKEVHRLRGYCEQLRIDVDHIRKGELRVGVRSRPTKE